ncbi:MGDG synthase family glycosyltransferase [Halalkalibacterium ligniniphilum]|uniref:MGDG synthase family glycosyltransferase n=1 Tax=Halalkalibacterium ligniniphilum TaxID=1134413 RepID=UPI00034DFB66|nr:glycosyltransferase [Halalkalibacterium ligniniphilum]
MKQQSMQRKILFLPFLQLTSGHHQVAKSLADSIQAQQSNVQCDTVDILSYSYGNIERLVSTIYLKWIHSFPSLYNHLYQLSVYRRVYEDKRSRLYEGLFMTFMKKLIKEKQPDLIICTHALPSYIVNRLKEKGELTTPVINVYTDYFIHRFWGLNKIDTHFVPSHLMKRFLEDKGIEKERIVVTGIPIHQHIKKQLKPLSRPASPTLSVLIAGGNLGVGALSDFVEHLGESERTRYFVLCGKNKVIFQKLKKEHKPNLIPLDYIESREEMDDLYNQVDAIITKPGGVTISESLFKRKPLFIYHALPGQEEINLQQLEQLGVVIPLKNWRDKRFPVEEQLHSFFQEQQGLNGYHEHVDRYLQQLTTKDPSMLIQSFLNK